MARSDMFLKAVGQRTGEIAGESNDKHFRNQIDVVDWSWGMSAPSAVGGQRTGRTLMKEVVVHKRADKASTSLMMVMRNNELLTSVVLSVRKSGGTASLPYWVMTLQNARINAYDVESSIDVDGSPMLREIVTFAFRTVSIDYTVQSATGGAVGSSNFNGDSGPEP